MRLWKTILPLFSLILPSVVSAGDWCAVGNPVGFKIQRTELPVGDYCEFLNACARKGDPYKLWNPLMEEYFWGGIMRKTAPDGFRYAVKDGYENYPATCMTWTSVARFCNWMAYGKPVTGSSELGTTEGNGEFGVYDTRTWQDKKFVAGELPIKRNTSDSYFIPTADEWRLAAYGDKGQYPFASVENPTQKHANFYDGKWALPNPHFARVDAFAEYPSVWGTLNQGGNVAEWVETRRGNFFLALGGSLIRGKYGLSRDFQEGDEADKAISSFGFRLCSAVNVRILPRPQISSSHAKRPVDSQNERTLPKYCLVADVGNPKDPLYGKGQVNHSFEIARHALTNEEYCRFLNAVAAGSDPHGLYNENMGNAIMGGIDKLSDGTYKPKNGWEKRPVVYVGFHDAMRYCNWLHYGKTEGTDVEGAYDTRFCDKVVSGDMAAPANYGRRNAVAKYWIPSDDEWYKAAYYDPTRTSRRKYWDYPCRTSNLPNNKTNELHSCNYLKDGVNLGLGAPFYLANVDEYPNSDTYYGVRQMAGNAWEWVEPNNPQRCLNLRGTSFGYTEFGMGAWNCDEAGYKDELDVFGIRIARKPKIVEIYHMPIKDRVLDFINSLGPRMTVVYFATGLSVSFLLGAMSVLVLFRKKK